MNLLSSDYPMYYAYLRIIIIITFTWKGGGGGGGEGGWKKIRMGFNFILQYILNCKETE